MKLIPLFLILISSCATEIPGSICAEYMNIRRVSKNYVFCNNGTVWDRHERIYLNRDNEIDLPDVKVEEFK